MKLLWKLSREAVRYKNLYVLAILATLGLTGVNLAAPRVLSAMTGIVERGVDKPGLGLIGWLTLALVLMLVLMLPIATLKLSGFKRVVITVSPSHIVSFNYIITKT